MYGRHILIDFYDCPGERLDDHQLIEESLLKAAKVARATILHHNFHKFAPQGVSGVIVIAESHISIHTWPEEGYAAMDIFTCGKHMRPEAAITVLKAVFEPGHVEIQDMQRGTHKNPTQNLNRNQTLSQSSEIGVLNLGLSSESVPESESDF